MRGESNLLEVQPGVHLQYIEWTTGSTQVPPIVCLHGLGESKDLFATFTAPKLLQAGAQHLIAIDWPGSGSSTPLEKNTLKAYEEILLSFLEARRITQCHLVGVSMGANIALSFAVNHPERVLTVCAQGTVNKEQLPKRLGRLAAKIWTNIPRWLFNALNREWTHGVLGRIFNSTDLVLLDRQGLYRKLAVEIAQTSSRRVFRENLEDLLESDIREVIGKIAVPTLLTDGAKVAWGTMMASLPSIVPLVSTNTPLEVKLIENAGHLAPYSNPSVFAQVLMDFVQRHPSQ